MPLSKQEREQIETDFKYLIKKYIESTNVYNSLISKSTLSKVDEKDLEEVRGVIQTLNEVISAAMLSVGNDLFGKAVDMYYHFKETAETGDVQAKKLIKDLKPIFHNSLYMRINNN